MPTTLTVQVVVRHAADCPHKAKGTQWRGCKCLKSIVVYDGETKKTLRMSAKTRSWEQAERFAVEYRESRDPLQQELKRLKAAEQRKQMLIEQAIQTYLTDMVARSMRPATVDGARHILQHRLLDWLAKQTPRPTLLSEITPEHLIQWRAQWGLGDLTTATRWAGVKTFFNFCVGQGWIADSPAQRIRPPKVARGGRTAVFSDEQVEAIIATAQGDPRLAAFIELLRWSGMAMSDAVQFQPGMMDKDGVLHYRRFKTNEVAVVPLPAHVVVSLRGVDTFRTKDNALKSDVRYWQRRLGRVFKRAGVTQVQTETGKTCRPHAHCFRDTFAVGALRHGASLHTVSRMLGHSNVTTTQKAYLPFVKELKQAVIADARQALAAATPKPKGKVVGIAEKRSSGVI